MSAEGELPPYIERVAAEVAQVRGLAFERPVAPQSLTVEEMNDLVNDQLEQQFPVEKTLDSQRTWITMGVVPAGTDLRKTAVDFTVSQVAGFYDSGSKRLVFVGGEDPSPLERLTLAHELTHALDDQHFDLSQLDTLVQACLEDRLDAYQALAEGDAQETSMQWAAANLSPAEVLGLQAEAARFPPPPDTPPFVESLFIFPYSDGQAFVEALLADGGERAVDGAFQDPPASTEQILHPEKYPDDAPQVVNVQDLSAALGAGWSDLDFQDVGEGWLRLMLQLRLGQGEADDAAEGWDGGQYRAWSDGARVAVVLDSVWDTEAEADEFAGSMESWLGTQPAAVLASGASVRVLFASDSQTLALLRTAAG